MLGRQRTEPSQEIAAWVGVDLDGTLAEYHGFVSIDHIGKPIPVMVNRVKEWLNTGVNVKIFTARAAEIDPMRKMHILNTIANWSLDVFGISLPVTCIKDYGCIQIWDDRAIQIISNTGERADGKN